MTLSTILVIVLILLFLAALPAWRHSRGWGYGPSVILAIVAAVLLVLILLGRA